MKKSDRMRQKILALLQCHGALRVKEAAAALNCSEVTIRQYFAELEKAHLLLRTHGGVRLLPENPPEYSFQSVSASKVKEKRAIARECLTRIRANDRLFFDSGTSVRECGNILAEEEEKLENIVIVTNSMALCSALASLYPVTVTGGVFRPKRMDLCGCVAQSQICRYSFTKAILGVDGIGENGELYTTDEESAALASAAAEHSMEIFVLCDSSKIFRSSLISYGTLADRKITLITDSGITEENLLALRKCGAEKIVIADC